MDAIKLQSRSFFILPGLILTAFLLILYTFGNLDTPLILWKCFSTRTNLTRPTAKIKQNCTKLLQTLLFDNSPFSPFHADRLDKRKFQFDSALKLYRYDYQLIIWTYRKVQNKCSFDKARRHDISEFWQSTEIPPFHPPFSDKSEWPILFSGTRSFFWIAVFFTKLWPFFLISRRIYWITVYSY